MIVVTGGAGFIGSAVVWALNNRGIRDILIVDELKRLTEEKKENLKFLNYKDLMDKEKFLREIKAADCIIHMGACSKTTETNEHYLMDTNYEYTKKLAIEAVRNNIRFIYASSAATYGDGSDGFSDSHERLEFIKPLNMYGSSKHLFDLWAKENGYLERITGLKYFNVYGPNEYHKGSMRSFVIKAFNQINRTGKVRLFKSYNSDYADGEQVRDFIYIKDAVDMTLYFLDNKVANGIYNIGTGVPRTWNDLVKAVFNAMDRDVEIEYIDMPLDIKDQYQYYTSADMEKFRNSGFNFSLISLEEGIKDYVQNYLVSDKHLQ